MPSINHMKDYYKILGLDKSATKEDVKKAFRKIAHEHHPDKTKNDPSSSQKFKEASEAYSVLSDDKKRQQYDTFGSGYSNGSGFNPGNFGGFDFSGFTNGSNVEFDLGDIFGDIFGGNRGSARKSARGSDISVDLRISFEESVFGVEKEIRLTKNSSCSACNGSGAETGSSMETCAVCSGKGRINETRRSFIGVFTTQRTCDHCHGRGKIPRNTCSTCRGSGISERTQEIIVKIPSGIEDGEMIRLNGMGEAIAGGVPGDMYVKIHVKPHAHIRKEGLNLVAGLQIKLSDALLGANVSFISLDGDIDISIPEGTSTGDLLRIRGKGVPGNNGKRGDLLIEVTVKMPKKLSKRARTIIEELKKDDI